MSTPTTVESVTLQSSAVADLQSVIDRVCRRAPELVSPAYRAGILLASGAVRSRQSGSAGRAGPGSRGRARG